jgi:hypothetical protein
MQVLIKNGTYRNAPVQNTVFPLVKGLIEGAKGAFITVDASNILPGRDKIRINVNDSADYEIIGNGDSMEIASVPTQAKKEETDEEVMARIGERFSIMDAMTQAVVEGIVRSMIVVGPPGVGKSYGIVKKLEEANLFNLIASDIRYEVVKGATTALGLYAKLYEFSREGDVLVFDDCDSILMDELSLNILKAALDTNKKRVLHWNSDSKLLQRDGIPNKFEFKGACIFITNIKFDNVRSKKLRDHLEALESRSHYIDLTMDSMRDKYLRIKQIAATGELFKEFRFTEGEDQEVLEFMFANQSRWREMSMRCAVKLAALRKTMPHNWQRTATITLMKNAF